MAKLWWQQSFIMGAPLFEFLLVLVLKLTSIQSPVGTEVLSETLPLYPLIWKVWIFISFDWITVYFCLRLNTSFVIVRATSLCQWVMHVSLHRLNLKRGPGFPWQNRVFLRQIWNDFSLLWQSSPVCQPKYTDCRPSWRDRILVIRPEFLPRIKLWRLL